MSQNSLAVTTRRQKISKAESTVFIAVAIAAVLVVFSVISMRFLWQQKSYNDRVIKAKTEARDTLKSNLANIDKLSSQFTDLENGSTNSTTILHALPPVYDYASLATAMQSLAQQSGVTLVGDIGQDQSESAIATADTSQPVEVPLTLQVNGSYSAVVKYVQNLELSIRPIKVTNLTLNGDQTGVKATVTATTYYQPTRSLDVSKSEVR